MADPQGDLRDIRAAVSLESAPHARVGETGYEIVVQRCEHQAHVPAPPNALDKAEQKAAPRQQHKAGEHKR